MAATDEKLQVTLVEGSKAKLLELCERTGDLPQRYILSTLISSAHARGGPVVPYDPSAVNPVNPAPSKPDEPKRSVGRPPVAAPQPTRKKHPVGDVVFIKDAALIAEGQEYGTCTSGWLVKTPIGTAGDIFWVNAYLICEHDPDHPCGFKPPHAFAIDESHLPYVRSQIANLGTPGGYQPLTKPEPPASAYFDGYIDGIGFDTEEDALAWAGEQMVAGKGDELWIKHGIRP